MIDLSTLTISQGFLIQGDAAGDFAGWSVASAGDVNGDGIDDVIVGARRGDNGGSDSGEAYVIYGVAGATRGTLDLSTLTAAQGFIIQGDAAGDRAGYSVSSAGDVNGDGIDDLIVGAPRGNDGGFRAGEAYVIYGVAGNTRGTVDLTGLASRPADGFIIQGDDSAGEAGRSVSSAGDVNGDGIDDLIVGAPYGNQGGTQSGEAYVIYGVLGTRATLDLTNLTAAQGFVIGGDVGGDNAGFSVSGAGDVNGDGIDDLIVGAPNGNDGGSLAGEAYVVYGVAGSTRGPLDLRVLAASDGFIIQGDAAGDKAGWSVSGAGDVNGDGIDDVIVGARSGFDGGFYAGEAYVIYGVAGATRGTVDLTGLAGRPADGFIIQGDTGFDQTGWSVSEAGDVNGDGIDDLIVGALLGDDGGIDAGEAYVIYGVEGTTRGTVDLTNLSASDGFVIQGDEADDRAGGSVSAAGDVNGDGIDDLIVGAHRSDTGGTDAGEAYVIYGTSASGFGLVVDLTGLQAPYGFIVQGDVLGDEAGYSVSIAGDVNGDGIDDLIIGAPKVDVDGSGVGSGEAYVIYGIAGSTRAMLDLSTLTVQQGFIIQGDDIFDFAGGSVSSAGDVNGDGIGDLIVGARDGEDGGFLAGEAYVIYGMAGATRGTVDLTGLSGRPADGFIIVGDMAYDRAGHKVSSAGDVNGDGIDDMIIGARTGDDGGADAGEAYVIYGVTGTRSTLDLSTLTPTQGFIIQGDSAGDNAGTGVSGAGDVNGDGIDDLIVGAPRAGEPGEAYVIYGVAGTARGTVDLTGLAAGDGFIIRGDANLDRTGYNVSSAGDVNGDGIDDLIVGARTGDDGGSAAGEAYVIYGVSGSTRGTLLLTGLASSDGFIIQGDLAGDEVGFSVSSAGDVNGDGIDDMIVGAPYGDDGGVDAGEAYVIFGVEGTTRGMVDLSLLSPVQGFIIQGDTAGDRAGMSVSGAGDVNGDGIDDLIVGAPYGDDGGADAGEAYVIYGRRPTLAVERTGTAIAQAIFGGDFDDTLAGLAGGDTLFGGGGADSLDGGSNADLIYGGDDDDTLLGGSGADTLQGEAGADLIYGGSEADTVDGGAGADTLYGDGAADSLIGGSEADLIYGGTSNDTLLGGTNGDSVYGGDQNDSIEGNEGADLLYGEAGADVIYGGSEADTIDGGSEADTLYGDGAADSLFGGSEADLLYGGTSNDTLRGGTGDDTVYGGDQNDVIAGNENADLLFGDAGNDTLFGGSEADTLDGGSGSDTLYGDGAADSLIGGSEGDLLYGGTSDDTLQGGTGADTVYGGDQNDVIEGNEGADLLYGDTGADLIYGGSEADTMDGGSESDTLYGDGAADSLNGGSEGDLLFGGTSNDTLRGGTGDDTVYGGDQNDVIAGNENADLLFGDAGNDTVYGGSENDTLRGGTEEDSLFGGDQNDLLAGNDGNDVLAGDSGLDTLFGGSGNDTLNGGTGSDALTGDTGLDVFVFNTAIGVEIDTITDFSVADDIVHLENAVFTGLAAGALGAAAFASNLAGLATTAAHRVIYETDTGALFFDADGTGAGARVQFATLGTGLALTEADFFVV